MKKEKKGLALILGAVMLAQVLWGCTSPGKAPEQEADSSTLQIGIVAKGYGDEFAYKLAEAFEVKTGIKTEVVKSSAASDWVNGQLLAGAENNDIDIIFDINPRAMRNVAVENYVKGYERAYVDLSEIYDEVPEGYDTDRTLKELISSNALSASTWGSTDGDYGNGKQYFAVYATGMEGLIYNADLFETYNIEIPKTTNELFGAMDQIKELGAKNDDGRDIYPYVYSGKANYSNYLGVAWWAQYDGVAVFNNMLEGKDASGNYTADSLKSAGKLSAMTIVSKILDRDNGYTDESCYTQSFTDAQMKFLDGQAFMMSTGEWIEREMQSNFEGQSLNIAMMRIPVNSDIILQCDSVKTEEQLSETIAYIDGEGEKPSYLSDTDLARLKEARSVYCSEGSQHIAYIPAYSNMAEEAKDFFRFMYSKEGQEIMLRYSYGNMAPLNVDITGFDYYESLSNFQKSKYIMQTSGVGINLVGNNYYHPMAYAGSVETFYNTPTMENAFGAVKASDTYMTAEEIWLADYNRMAAKWANNMSQAGVSN